MTVNDYFMSMQYGTAPESDSAARQWLASHQSRFTQFIGGRFTKADDNATFETLEPATGKVLATLSQASQGDVDAAVKAARKAQKDWQAMGGHARARHLYSLARMLQKHSRLFAVLESLDNGKPIRESRDLDVPLAARHFLYHAGIAQLQETELAQWQPYGVVGQIIPWNFPLLMLAWKVAPALASGNTVVLKPAELTSLTALLFAELAAQTLPAGVLNVVTGDGAVGQYLVAHKGVDKIAFTGSTEVGRLIRSQTAGSGKGLTLELGGKSPFIIFDDADIDSAIEGIVDAIWFNQGQVCCAGSRLLVQESIAEQVYAKLRARMKTLRVGPSLDKNIDMSAIIDATQLQRIRTLVTDGVSQGGQLWQPTETTLPGDGAYYPPTLITGVQPASTLAQEEIFGPVLVSMTFRTPQEAVELANNTRYGLAASVWSENINLALDIAPKLRCGVVWINASNLFDAAVGFGGVRESGYGREGGLEGIYEYLKPASWAKAAPYRAVLSHSLAQAHAAGDSFALPAIDRTAKLYIGGKQTRPDNGASLPVIDSEGKIAGHISLGSRKDIRNAVAAARKATGWQQATTFNRAQVLYYLAENLSYRADELVQRLARLTGSSTKNAAHEFELGLERLFTFAAWADKYDGRVHTPPMRGVALAIPEAIGVIGVICPDDAPWLSMISLIAAGLAMGNSLVVVPGARSALLATDLYQVLETSDVPAGVVNIVTGDGSELAAVLADHDDVDSVWAFGDNELAQLVQQRSVGNLKRTFGNDGKAIDWYQWSGADSQLFLRQATQIKNIWIPYGD
ncbi:aldehyde dehydrogenase family protein [Advenella mimigardefordensis]|uniref:Aldehyde dehydrogenase n=1 Tax=Advenella mimigardefordensis (strain DSM 17166 / LMG 22922 / DPN7) TaxID=1247726 RepID=W0PKD9_ADVMD|nr:aldehyde dehydrogenase family protein [Advenella mimigardefordensis]AHG66025.1 aldehyde dehydrogenase [Advenella mimigardefordensis DPN7]